MILSMNTVETIEQFFLEFGATWVLWLLFALSVITILITAERLLFYAKKRGNLRELAEQLDRHLAQGNTEQALQELHHNKALAASVAYAGLRLSHLGPASADKAMKGALALEKSALQKRLVFLGTLGNNAPFIGLFGTVIGVIMALDEIGHGAGGHTAGAVASQAVMSGIAEALVATAVGIAVALPAVAAHNYLQRRVTQLLSDSNVLSNLVLAYLSHDQSTANRAHNTPRSSAQETRP